MKILSISYMMPPYLYPQSIQIGRLLYHSKLEHILVTAELPHLEPRLGVYNDFESKINQIIKIEDKEYSTSLFRKLSYYLVPFYSTVPDQYRDWANKAKYFIKEVLDKSTDKPSMVISFGVPMSDHLIGLFLKKKMGMTWVAHFSDPWSDNPFKRHHFLSKYVNKRLEKMVISNADEVIFTSVETKNLVMKKYPKLNKGLVLGHYFDRELYPLQPQDVDKSSGIIIRHVGNFYGYRSPEPLFQALANINKTKPSLLNNVSFEFFGGIAPRMLKGKALASLPEGLVKFEGNVDYKMSLEKMVTSDLLLLIDAPAKESVFLPSKLIDYLGSYRPVMGITPPGTSQKLLSRLGMPTCPPDDISELEILIENYILNIDSFNDKTATKDYLTEVGIYDSKNISDNFDSVMKTIYEEKV